MKKILVITATLGNRKSLARTIESVKSIGGGRIQHVLIAPERVIEDLKNMYGENLIYEPEPVGCKGIYTALNHGFRKYGNEYDYLTFINDDDYWLLEYRTLIDYMLSHGTCDFVYGKTSYVDEKNVYIGNQTSCGNFKDFIPLLREKIVMLTQQSTIIRSSLFFEIGGFDESYKLVADTKFWALLSLKNIRYKYFDKCCAAYMIQDGQLSSDHTTQAKEGQRLLAELPPSSTFSCKRAKFMFRIKNAPVYFKRLMKKQGYKNPFTRQK